MASRIKHLRARALKAFFNAHMAVYEASGGRIGAKLGGLPCLLLTTTGRKSGIARTTPLVYFKDGRNYVVVGSDGAARRDPQWWKNLQAQPHGNIRDGRSTCEVTARLAAGEERARLWQIGVGINPMWGRYQTQTERILPVVILEPVA